MLRHPASRVVLRSLNAAHTQQLRASLNAKSPTVSRLCTLSNSKRPQSAPWKPVSAVLWQRQRYASTQWDKPDTKAEQELAQKKLKPEPELVSSTSSIHPVFGEVATPEPAKDPDMMKGIRQDVVRTTPKKVLYIGAALTSCRKPSKTRSPSPKCRIRHTFLAWRECFPTWQRRCRRWHARMKSTMRRRAAAPSCRQTRQRRFCTSSSRCRLGTEQW